MAFNPRDIALVTARDEETKKLNKKLWEALEAHDAAAVEEYLEKGRSSQLQEGKCTQHITCCAFDLICFLFFFALQWVYGADLCWTPLHFAVWHALTDIMRVLFRYSCDVLLRTPAGEIAKDLAIERDNAQVIALLDQLTEQQEEERMAYIELYGEPDPEKIPAIKYGIYGAGYKNVWKLALEEKQRAQAAH